MSLANIYNATKTSCACGKEHISTIDEICVGKGVINKLLQIISKYNPSRAFILSDKNTYKVAGKKVCEILSESGMEFASFTLDSDKPEPDEYNVGSVIMNFDTKCDIVIAVGSGVINDIGKILANVTNSPYIIVATAPSMDGYASATSSISRGGLKVSLNSKSADAIIGDIDILKNAPIHMLKSGLGDMLAKYISICEWRIAKLLIGEYYCEDVADFIRKALKKCVDNAHGLLNRDEKAVEAVFEGLVIGGLAMAYAGLSRPASGVEHYMSHIWDMRGLEFGIPTELHGIQCAYAAYVSVNLYEKIKKITPNQKKALEFVSAFDFREWSNELYTFLGKGANTIIAQEEKECKYDLVKHKKRLDIILDNWDKIIEIISEEIPEQKVIEELFVKIGLPTTSEEIGVEKEILPMTFKAAKDIRDKYVLPRLCWDLGIIDELALNMGECLS